MRADKRTYAGLFVITLSTLMYEILLTRIFSVTMWYHFAFVAISVAMFGMTVGALAVYLRPAHFTPQRTRRHLGLSALCFAVSIVFSFLTHLSIPFKVDLSITGLYAIALNYAVLAVPFVFSGICVCLALTRFPGQVGRLYAADLAGAALGCVLLVLVLEVTDGPTAVIGVACLASLGAWLFTPPGESRRLTRAAAICTVLLAVLALGHTWLVWQQRPALRLVWVKDEYEPRPLYEKWNSFSRIQVNGDPRQPRPPVGWGLSPTCPQDRPLVQLDLDIDANAGTVLTAFDGDLGRVAHLKYDATNVVYYLRSAGSTLVVGAGGGRDVLSALAFGQPQITAVEINRAIIDAVNRRFGDLTGHLDRYPQVTFVNDEARSYIARQARQFDVIQISLIDTWAATAAGAFVLTENSLYTVEAWEVFLLRLSPTGVLSVSRWYFSDQPAQMHRLTALAVAALQQAGIPNPRDHILIVRCMGAHGPQANVGIGTLLLSKTPFSPRDVETVERVCADLQFEPVLTPGFALDPVFERIASHRDMDTLLACYPVNIAPPTDDSPFFFNMLRLRDVFKRELYGGGDRDINLKAVVTLGALLATVLVLTLLCIILPLVWTSDRRVLRGAATLLVFFGSVGLGFMLVEISQMQRLIVFLGHPVYGLSVVLLALLLSSSIGSFLTPKGDFPRLRATGILRLLGLLVVLAVFGLLTPPVLRSFQGAATPVRILLAVGILFPIGLLMGMAFPLGMTVAARRSPALTPWLWGVNGATSVCASVLAVVIALGAGIGSAFWTGVCCYAVASGAFARAATTKG